jgi:hypothetical protein
VDGGRRRLSPWRSVSGEGTYSAEVRALNSRKSPTARKISLMEDSREEMGELEVAAAAADVGWAMLDVVVTIDQRSEPCLNRTATKWWEEIKFSILRNQLSPLSQPSRTQHFNQNHYGIKLSVAANLGKDLSKNRFQTRGQGRCALAFQSIRHPRTSCRNRHGDSLRCIYYSSIVPQSHHESTCCLQRTQRRQPSDDTLNGA